MRALVLTIFALLCPLTATAVPSTYDYDAAGRLTLEWVGDVRIEYSYDGAGNVLTQRNCEAACYIDGVCRTEGEVDPNDACQVCDSASAREAWTTVDPCTAPDMGIVPDMGATDDMGTTPMDMGTREDVGTGAADMHDDDDEAPGPVDNSGEDGGCKCSAAGGFDASGLLLVGILFAMRGGRRRWTAACAAILVVLWAPGAFAVTVCASGSCDYTSISEAVSDTPNSDTTVITVEPGMYFENGLRLFRRKIESSNPNDPGGVIIDGSNGEQILSLSGNTSPSVVRGITFRNTNHTLGSGGCVGVGGTVTFENVIFENCSTTSAGGALFGGGILTLRNVTFRDNSSDDDGGAVAGSFDELRIDNVTFEDNMAGGSGGAFRGAPFSTLGSYYLEVKNSTFTGNSAEDGGAIHTRTLTSIIENSSFTQNTAIRDGGAVYVGGNATAYLNNLTLSGNLADDGGGIAISNGSGNVTIAGGTISGNTATAVGDGGGVYCAGTGRMAGISAMVSGNTPDDFAGPCFGNCTTGMTQACTTNLPGVCQAGEQLCDANMNWGLCEPIQTPAPSETMCMDNIDEDCDGATDAADSDCQPARPTTQSQVGQGGRRADPVSTFTGEFFTRLRADIHLSGPLPVEFRRYYASGLEALGLSGRMGTNWRHNYEWSLVDDGMGTVTVTDHEGRLIVFSNATGDWVVQNFTDVPFQLLEAGASFLLYDPRSELFYGFTSAGVLAQISDSSTSTITLTYNVGGELISLTDARGRTLTLTYSGGLVSSVSDGTRTVSFTHVGGNLTSVNDLLSNTTTYQYATPSLLTSITEPAGNVNVSQSYDANGRVASQTNADGVTTFVYDDNANTCTMTDPAAGVTVHTHDLRGRLQQIDTAGGEMMSMDYDGSGRRVAVTNNGGQTTSETFAAGQSAPTSRMQADGLLVQYDHTSRFTRGLEIADVTTITYPDGSTETLSYDVQGNVLALTARDGNTATFTYNFYGQRLTSTNLAGGTDSFAYDANGLLVATTDNAGNMTTYTYDSLHRKVGETYADGSTRTYVVDDADRITSITDERGTVLLFGYDDNGNLTSSTDGEGHTTLMSYDALNRFTGYTDPLGNAATVTYGPLGNVVSETDRSGATTTFEYDADGRMTAMVDPAGGRWARTYDAAGWPATWSDPLQNTITYERDAAGRVTLLRTAGGHETTFGYDMLGQLTTITDPLGRTTTNSYDVRGYVSSIVMPAGVQVTYARNALGQVTGVTDGNGNTWAFDYDAAGRLLSSTDPLGNVTSQTYDDRNRATNWTFPGGLGTTAATYDGFGNVTAQTYSVGPSLSFTYDGRNLLTSSENLTLGYDENGLVNESNGITTTYDAGGRVATVSYPPGDVTYTYDVADNLTQVVDWVGNTTTFTYDAVGRRTGISRPNGVSTTVGYGTDQSIVSIIESDGATVSSVVLQRDATGNIVAADREVPTSPQLPTNDLSFTLDAASQITSFSYDALGRRTSDDTRAYTWDGASRLTGYSEGATNITFEHDGLLHVVVRSDNGTDDRFVWNYGTARPSIAIIERDGADRHYYVHTPEGELLYAINATTGAASYYHFDEMGNTLMLTDDAGVVTDSYGYTAYGELTARLGTTDNPFTFSGQYSVITEGDAGLYIMGRRFYDAGSKQFLSREPVVDMMHPMTVNPYMYAGNNPLRYIDPSGESGETKTGATPIPDGVKAGVKVTKLAKVAGSQAIVEKFTKHADTIFAAEQANMTNRLTQRTPRNPQWVETATAHSKKLQKLSKSVDNVGKLASGLGKAANVYENGLQGLAEEGAKTGAEKLFNKTAGKVVSIAITGAKTHEKVTKIKSQMKTTQSANYDSHYLVMDNIVEAWRLKLIDEYEFERRLKAAQGAFEDTVGGTKDAGFYGIAEECARGLKDMLSTWIGG